VNTTNPKKSHLQNLDLNRLNLTPFSYICVYLIRHIWQKERGLSFGALLAWKKRRGCFVEAWTFGQTPMNYQQK